MKKLSLIFCYCWISNIIFSQADTLLWNNGKIKEIRSYTKVDEYNFQSFHANGIPNSIGKINLWEDLRYTVKIESAYDKEGSQILTNGTGKSIDYFENLNVKSITNFCDSDKCLEYVEYHKNGKIKLIGDFGGHNKLMTKHKQGVWQFFDSTGNKVEERKYVNGNEYYLNAWHEGSQTLKNGNGRLTLYFDSGKIWQKGKIKVEKKWGIWKEYYPNSMLCSTIKYYNRKGENISDYDDRTAFDSKVINSFEQDGSQIAVNGTGYSKNLRPDETLETLSHFSNNRLDTVTTFYTNGNQFRIFLQTRLSRIELKTFYENGILESKRISEMESHYFDRNGILRSTIISKPIQKDDIEEFVITKYYADGKVSEIENCTSQLILNDTGEMYFDENCKKQIWDEIGNEIIFRDSLQQITKQNVISKDNLITLNVCNDIFDCKGFLTDEDSIAPPFEKMNVRAEITHLQDSLFQIKYKYRESKQFAIDTFKIYCWDGLFSVAYPKDFDQNKILTGDFSYISHSPASTDERDVVYICEKEDKIIFYWKE